MNSTEIYEFIQQTHDFESAHDLIEYTRDMYAWNWIYSTMHQGQRGHFVTVGYLPSPVHSSYEHITVQENCFIDAIKEAASKALNDLMCKSDCT